MRQRPPRQDRGHRFIDSNYRSNAENADLAAGYARVLVLSPFGGRTLQPLDRRMYLVTHVDGLRTGGSRVENELPGRQLPAQVRR